MPSNAPPKLTGPSLARPCLYKKLAATAMSFLGLITNVAWAAEASPVTFSAKPNKCIALRKGQDCYQTVHFHWRTPEPGQYCLYAEGQSTALHCWQGAGAPPFKYEFVGQTSQTFYIRAASGTQLASQELLVAWVYSSGRRDSGGWRLF